MDPTGNIVNPQIVPQPAPLLIPGGRLNRWVASILDSFFLGLAEIPLVIVSEIIIQGKVSFDEPSLIALTKNPWVIILALLITGLYKIGFLVKNEATPGKNWRKLKVVQNRDGKRIDLFHASVREISQIIYNIPLLGTLLYLISVILVLFSKSRRALHDLIAGTIVVVQS